MPIPTPKTVPHVVKGVIGDNLTILLFGHTGAGKTALIGELAEYYFKTTHKYTRLYTADRGGWVTVKPYVDLGVIEVIPMFGDPWLWLDHAVKGDKLEGGKWVPGLDTSIALYAFEGMTSIADSVMDWMAQAAAKGVNIGGGGSFSFMAGEGSEKIKIGSNNMAHYSVAQQQVYQKSTQSQSLPGTVLWTAGDRRGEDDAIGGVVGPQVAGKALTGEVPRWFKYTFRVATEVTPGQDPVHVLYTDSHVEMQSKGMAKGISNSRVPLAGGIVKIPPRIEPASLTGIMELLEQRQNAATDEIAKRLGITRG